MDKALLTNKLSNRFSIIPNDVIEHANISWGAKGLLTYLLSRPDGWQFFVGDLLKRAQSSVYEIRKLLAELEKAGLLKRERTIKPGTNQLYWKWEVLPEKTNLRYNEIANIVNYDNRKIVTYNNTDLDSNTDITDNIPPISPPKGDDDVQKSFQEFWDSYKPVSVQGRVVVKGSRKIAEQKYRHAIKGGAKPSEILAGAQAYLAHCMRNQVLSCGVGVFLNQERWKDEYPAESQEVLI